MNESTSKHGYPSTLRFVQMFYGRSVVTSAAKIGTKYTSVLKGVRRVPVIQGGRLTPLVPLLSGTEHVQENPGPRHTEAFWSAKHTWAPSTLKASLPSPWSPGSSDGCGRPTSGPHDVTPATPDVLAELNGPLTRSSSSSTRMESGDSKSNLCCPSSFSPPIFSPASSRTLISPPPPSFPELTILPALVPTAPPPPPPVSNTFWVKLSFSDSSPPCRQPPSPPPPPPLPASSLTASSRLPFSAGVQVSVLDRCLSSLPDKYPLLRP